MLLSQDRDLLERFRRGDRGAMERVFEHYAPQVGRWVGGGFSFKSKDIDRRFDGFRSAVDLHDTIHEVFRAAFEIKARESYSGLSPYEGYLFVITRNVVLKRLRIKDRDRPLDQEALAAIPSGAESAEDRVARDQEIELVRSFLATLSEEDRGFVELRFSEQLPQLTVGERLGWSRKKVRIKEASVRERLIKFIKRRRGREEIKEVLHDGTR